MQTKLGAIPYTADVSAWPSHEQQPARQDRRTPLFGSSFTMRAALINFRSWPLNYCGVCYSVGAFDAVVCWHHARGGEGAKDLGEAVIKACQQPTQFKFLYPLDISIKARSLPMRWLPTLPLETPVIAERKLPGALDGVMESGEVLLGGCLGHYLCSLQQA